MTLTAAAILAANDLKTERIETPAWGGSVLVRTLTSDERDAFERSIYATRGTDVGANAEAIRARLCALVIVDDEGRRVFSDAQVGELGKKSAAMLDLVFAKAQELNGIGVADVAELAGVMAPRAAQRLDPEIVRTIFDLGVAMGQTLGRLTDGALVSGG